MPRQSSCRRRSAALLSANDLVVSSPKVRVAQGATVDAPLTARLLANGTPVSGQTLNFLIGLGSGTVNPASAVTS